MVCLEKVTGNSGVAIAFKLYVVVSKLVLFRPNVVAGLDKNGDGGRENEKEFPPSQNKEHFKLKLKDDIKLLHPHIRCTESI